MENTVQLFDVILCQLLPIIMAMVIDYSVTNNTFKITFKLMIIPKAFTHQDKVEDILLSDQLKHELLWLSYSAAAEELFLILGEIQPSNTFRKQL